MAKSFTSSALDINKFETAMSSVAPVAAAVGFSIEQTTASLGILTDAGFDASTAGTALRNILLDTQKAGISVTEAFRQVRESTDPATTALELFGKRGAAVGLTLAKNEDKANAFAKSLENAGGSAAAMAKIVGDTLEGDLKRLSSAWEGLILNFSETDALRDIVQLTTDLVGGISDLTRNVHEESDAMNEQRIKINVLVGRITSLNKGTDDRKKLIAELNALSPDFLKGLDEENLKNETLAKRLKKVNAQLINNILIKREEEKINEQGRETADAFIELDEAELEIGRKLQKQKTESLKIIESESNFTTDANRKRAQEIVDIIDNIENLTQIQRAQLVVQKLGNSGVNEATILGTSLGALLTTRQKTEEAFNKETAKGIKLAEDKLALEKRLGIDNSEDDQAAAANAAAKANIDLAKSFKL